ncbi:xylulokinase [Paenibacillus chungangensis]|uniref:Xylulokinase n=1 Tax=Paenibacillus chungangensis TaxID=696535 RepID=A0ABW3HR15_9BACL
MAISYVLGVDHGSGGCKITCLGSDGTVASEAYVSYPSLYPKPRWVEQDPNQWIDAAVEGIRKAISSFSTEQRSRMEAIAFSAPHHVAVLLDKGGSALRNVIMWNDQRSGDESKELYRLKGERIYDLTNNAPNPTWTLSHFLWLRKHEPEALERVQRIVFMKDYVRYRFSGDIATDHIEAEGSLFYDIHEQRWSDELLELIALDKSLLPPVGSPLDRAGSLTQEMADRLGLPAGIAIVMGTADTAAEVYGCGTVEAGDGVVKLATAGNFALVTDKLPRNDKLTAYHHVIDGLYYQNSATNFAAASFRWFKESFYREAEGRIGAEDIYDYIVGMVDCLPAGSEGLLFQPYLNGERSPHWDPYLRGSFFGTTTRHTREHFARAVLEGVAYSLRDCANQLSDRPLKAVKLIGGGSKGRPWIQIMASVLNLEMEIPEVSDSSFGACLIAATSIGWYSDLREAVSHAQRVVESVAPVPEDVKVYDEMFSIYRELHSRTHDLAHRLTSMQE